MQSKLINMVGQQYGKLTVVGPHKHIKDKYNHSRTLWFCKCECGNELWTSRDFLVNKDKVQCKDCKTLMLAANRKKMKVEDLYFKLPEGEASFNQLFAHYRAQARLKKREFSLTKEHFKILTSANCHYCNKKPAMKAGDSRHNGHYFYNGIDRKDNTKGYNKINSLSCCEDCNRAKLEMTYEQFISLVKAIYSNIIGDK